MASVALLGMMSEPPPGKDAAAPAPRPCPDAAPGMKSLEKALADDGKLSSLPVDGTVPSGACAQAIANMAIAKVTPHKLMFLRATLLRIIAFLDVLGLKSS